MPKDETQDCFRQTFSTAPGQKTLGLLLIDAGYFDDNLKTPEEQAVLNYAKGILKKCGWLELSNVDSYVRKLFEIPVRSANG